MMTTTFFPFFERVISAFEVIEFADFLYPSLILLILVRPRIANTSAAEKKTMGVANLPKRTIRKHTTQPAAVTARLIRMFFRVNSGSPL